MDNLEKSKIETRSHQETVKQFMNKLQNLIDDRSKYHDSTKLMSPELEVFAKHTPVLIDLEYNSDEYKQHLKEMNVALKHHYAHNRHHPEHFENGIQDMNLVDLIELVCDWKATSLRQNDGNVLTQMSKNKERFELSDQLYHIIKNTMELFELI